LLETSKLVVNSWLDVRCWARQVQVGDWSGLSWRMVEPLSQENGTQGGVCQSGRDVQLETGRKLNSKSERVRGKEEGMVSNQAEAG
jgi:hypothetical protein